MLTKKVSITVPGTDHGKPLPAAQQRTWVQKALREMSLWFGGATAVMGEGAWVTESGVLVVEPIVLVYSYCTPEAVDAYREKVAAFARDMAAVLGQYCVAVEYPEGMELIEPLAKAA